eukprot:7157068-Pyramimonas_sp.AAC.1
MGVKIRVNRKAINKLAAAKTQKEEDNTPELTEFGDEELGALEKQPSKRVFGRRQNTSNRSLRSGSGSEAEVENSQKEDDGLSGSAPLLARLDSCHHVLTRAGTQGKFSVQMVESGK